MSKGTRSVLAKKAKNLSGFVQLPTSSERIPSTSAIFAAILHSGQSLIPLNHALSVFIENFISFQILTGSVEV